MDVQALESLGQIAGIGGIAIGFALIIFRDVLRKKIFPELTKADAYRLIRMIVLATWSIAILGMTIWYNPELPNIIIGDGNYVDGKLPPPNEPPTPPSTTSQ